MEARYFLPALLVIAFLPGCSKEEKVTYAPMGSSAPAFGSTQDETVADFIEGRWALEGGFEGEADQSEFWQFSADGTFYYSQGESDTRVTGTWKEQGNGIAMSYEMLDDETINDAKARFQKEAEGGAQAAIANQMVMESMFKSLLPKNYFELTEDNKKLEIKDPYANEDDPFGLIIKTILVRLEEVKE